MHYRQCYCAGDLVIVFNHDVADDCILFFSLYFGIKVIMMRKNNHLVSCMSVPVVCQ